MSANVVKKDHDHDRDHDLFLVIKPFYSFGIASKTSEVAHKRFVKEGEILFKIGDHGNREMVFIPNFDFKYLYTLRGTFRKNYVKPIESSSLSREDKINYLKFKLTL